MMRIVIGLFLFCLLGAEPADSPRISLATLMEDRIKFVGDDKVYPFQSLIASIRLEGGKNIRSYGNLKVMEAKTDSDADLIRRSTTKGDYYYTTDEPRFAAIRDYQVKTNRIDVPISLLVAPRAAKMFKLKGSIDILVGGEVTPVDFPNIVAMKDKEILKNEAFSAVGLKITIIKEARRQSEKLVAYAVEGNNSIVKEIEVVDRSGKLIKTNNVYYRTRAGGNSHYRTSSQKIPEDAKLRVTISRGGKAVTLPFEFTNIQLP